MSPPLTFIVNVFKFFDRKDLEIIAETGNYVNRIVRKHFASKPYCLLNDVTIEICRDEDGLAVVFTKDAESQSSGDLCFNLYDDVWKSLEAMRPYLSQFVRFRKAELFFAKCPFTQEDMTTLGSISHVWSGQILWLYVAWQGRECHQVADMNFRNNASNSFHNILSNDAIFSTRCLILYAASQFASFHDYSRVYTVDVLLLVSYDDDEDLNIGALLALIENKPQFPESKTVFVVDISLFETRVAEVTDAICKSFSSASTPCPYQLLIIHDESNGENEEFRLENGTTREVLQLKNVKKDSSFVTKICEICNHKQFHDKFILIERSRL